MTDSSKKSAGKIFFIYPCFASSREKKKEKEGRWGGIQENLDLVKHAWCICWVLSRNIESSLE